MKIAGRILLVFALSCHGSEVHETPGAPSDDQSPSTSERSETSSIDRSAREARRLEKGETVVARFEGEFVSAGQPPESTAILPLDLLEVWYVVEVRLMKLLEGRLPDGWSTEIRFGVHSPAIFFGMRGLDGGEGRVPPGTFRFTLWWTPDGRYDLDAEALE